MKTKQVAYSRLVVKAVDDEKRVIIGMATTPDPDRVGDVVEPLGCQFKNPSPLLWMHDHSLPVGTVKFGKPTKDGVPFEASLPVIPQPSQLAARIDEAWQSVKNKLVGYVSIGFRPLEYSVIEDTGGYRFTKSEIYELSLVTVPANSNATINEVKSLDRATRAALGIETEESVSETKPRASGKSVTVKLVKEESEMKTLAEKLKGFIEARDAKKARMVELATKAADAGETFSVEEQEEFDNLDTEVKTLDGQIDRTQKAVTMAASTATPVTEKAGQDERGSAAARSAITVKAVAETVPGLGFARFARAKFLAKQENRPAEDIAKRLWPDDTRVADALQKAAVAAGTTTDSTWAAPLVPTNNGIAADFAEYLRPATIIGKFGTNGIPALRRVPFRTRLLSQTSGGEAYWTGEGNAKPLTKFDFAGTTLDPLKVASIAVITKELLLDSSPDAETLVRDGLRDALVARLDQDFIDPAVTASAGVRPASITNGVSTIGSTGSDADAIRCDVQALLNTYIAANNPPSSGVLIMSAMTALALSMMQNPLGQQEFPGLTMNGGVFLGFPVIVSEYVEALTAGHNVYMVNAQDIYYADGDIEVDMSDQASLQMNDAPDNPTTASTVMVSLWQRNMVGFLVEKRINYKKRRSSAVAVLTGVNWGACGS